MYNFLGRRKVQYDASWWIHVSKTNDGLLQPCFLHVRQFYDTRHATPKEVEYL